MLDRCTGAPFYKNVKVVVGIIFINIHCCESKM